MGVRLQNNHVSETTPFNMQNKNPGSHGDLRNILYIKQRMTWPKINGYCVF